MKTENASPDKSQLAKLLATENINVVINPKLQTAAFDLKSRTMHLPNWEGVSAEVIDLLVGHETGHALFTPEEGWHGAIEERGQAIKSYLNVCEDARIEKKQKRKYPGLRKSFQKGYKELFDRNFFGTDNLVLEDLLLIDRVNLKCKLGSLLDIPFTAEEKLLLAEVEATETWADVRAIAEKLLAYCKKEKQEKAKQPQPPESDDSEDEDGEDYESYPSYDDSQESEEGEDEQENSDSSSEDSDEDGEDSDEEEDSEGSTSSPSEEGEEDEEEDDEEEESTGRGALNQEQNEEEADDSDVESITDNRFRDNEGKLASTGNLKIVELPDVVLQKALIRNNQIVNSLFHGSVQMNEQHLKDAQADFMARNKNAIDLYVKEFQMRKSAAAWKKARQSDTGDINANKLAYYTLTDQVFKSRTIVPNGKNHGMVLLLDWSTSMCDSFLQSMEQVLILASFCKRVGIPFQVLAFTNRNNASNYPFIPAENTLVLDTVNLLELLSSDMNASQYNQAFQACLTLGASLTYSQIDNIKLYRLRRPIESWLCLGGTPLKPALLVLRKLIPEFQKKTRVDITNLVIVTDGGCTSQLKYVWEQNEYGRLKDYHLNYDPSTSVPRKAKLKVKNRFFDLHKFNGPSTDVFLDILRDECGINIFGFFLISGRITAADRNNIYSIARDQNGMAYNIDLVLKELREKSLFEAYARGYSRFFLVKNKAEKEVTLSSDASLAKVKTAFKKNNSDRKANRILASKFMELAA